METSTIWRIERMFKDNRCYPFQGIYGTREALIKALRKLFKWYEEGNADDVCDIFVYRADLNDEGLFVWQKESKGLIKHTSVYELRSLGIID